MFLPKRSKIFENITQQANFIEQSAEVFLSAVENWKKIKEKSIILQEIEGRADEFVHLINDEIEKSFILPLDK